MKSLSHNFTKHWVFHCVVHQTENVAGWCMILFLRHPVGIDEFTIFQSKFLALPIHLKQKSLDVIFMAFVWVQKRHLNGFFKTLWVVLVDSKFAFSAHHWQQFLFILVTCKIKPSSKFGCKYNWRIIAWWKHQRTKTIINCHPVINLQISACATSVGSLLACPQVYVLKVVSV